VGGRAITFHKNIPGHGSYQWENGAGRIHSSHKWVVDLVDKYGLTKIPIEGGVDMRLPGKSDPIPVDFEKYLKAVNLAALSKDVLLENTLASLLNSVVGQDEANAMINTFEYRSEVDTLRADRALESLNGEIGQSKGFFVLKEGFSYLVEKLQNEAEKLGVVILKKHSVTDFQKLESAGGVYKVFVKDHIPIKAGKVVVAIPRDAVAELPCLKNLPILQKVKMRPLVRMYAVFPTSGKGGCWFQGLNKFVCDLPIRYVLPINPMTGVIMISYTDGDDTKHWHTLKDQALENAIQKELHQLFPDTTIPAPTWLKKYDWPFGCSYWRPTPGNYALTESLLEAENPSPNLYICGESVSYHQGWMEGALESAERLNTHIKNQVSK
jgi:hypothetical protein